MHTSDWESNVFAGLEELDDEGHDRVSQFLLGGHGPPGFGARLRERQFGALDDDDSHEPKLRTSSLAELGEMELAAQPPRLA